MIRIALLRSALLTWPSAGLWRRASAELIWLAPVLAFLAWAGGLTDAASTPEALSLAKLAAVVVLAPALAEEIVFRVLLLPSPSLRPRFWPCAWSIALFVLWHPLQMVFGPDWARVVLNPAFLAAGAALGLALTRIYFSTHSIWPCVVLHWFIVVIWKAMGGPSPWG